MCRAIVAAANGWLWPAAVLACTVCDSQTGRQVRDGIFGENFWSTLLAVVSPFPVLLVTIATIQWLLSRPTSAHPYERNDLHT
ncbi:MAG TPA: hypothetical protein VK993_16030 [Chthoniobacterales bacterium]|nr:hypothetical protein [Chthoniobacterales bacterium]